MRYTIRSSYRYEQILYVRRMADPPQIGVPVRNLQYSEMLVIISERQRASEERLQQHTAALHHLSNQIVHLQQQIALSEQADIQLRQQVTQAILAAAEARRTADGVGDALDRLRQTVERGQETETGRTRVWVVALLGLIVLIILISVIAGVHL